MFVMHTLIDLLTNHNPHKSKKTVVKKNTTGAKRCNHFIKGRVEKRFVEEKRVNFFFLSTNRFQQKKKRFS